MCSTSMDNVRWVGYLFPLARFAAIIVVRDDFEIPDTIMQLFNNSDVRYSVLQITRDPVVGL
jgi:hypothetical protein